MTAPSWVCDSLGVELAAASADVPIDSLVQLGLRRNPKRAHLLVSTVLGKHLPTPPAEVRGSADALGDAVLEHLGPRAAAATVLGFAETATGLGHCVAARIGAARYLHSTRRAVAGAQISGSFEEGHSHATTHLLQPTDTAFLATARTAPVVLVDDEISTGRTAVEAIASLHALAPHDEYLVASLVDMRDEQREAECGAAAAELGVVIAFVSLSRGRIRLPDDLVERVHALDAAPLNPTGPRGDVVFAPAPWPAHVPDGGRHGFLAADEAPFDAAVDDLAEHVAGFLAADEAVTVVGHEELMYLPLCLAERLAASGRDVRYQTTTRSPAHVRDEPGYPLRRGFTFPSPEGPDPAARFVYNLAAPGAAVLPTVLLVLDSPADTDRLRAAGGLVDVLAAAGHRVVAVTVPATDPKRLADARAGASTRLRPALGALRGPRFGSYLPHEAAWLVKDLSAEQLEADIAVREKQIQAGRAHYAESLPVEFQPGPEYRELFDETLRQSAARLATAVGTVAELILTERTATPTLVSLARAGTPIGVLIGRWIEQFHGVRPPHYSVSIVRDRGIDAVALDHITARHDPASVVFVDGWTGKGAITRELADALDEYAAAGGVRLDPELAVLADPGSCTPLYGTRDDFLIASACLNSTVSGLVSRTVLNAELIGPGDFHGAKFYRDLASADVSNRFLDAISDRFDDVAQTARSRAVELRGADRAPSWAGWRSVERMQERYGLSSINFVKPGIGETTRVLLRRVPWRILIRDDDLPEHAHIRMLAAERGVPVDVVPDLAYSCIGLIKESV
ncbi:phosphoribosyltransferase [Gordonia hydrophobica]|uniref:Phosphoribosyltransferase n=1 Tax=Gordonia hydrophobica TaxID=40516 RepID=A0ABZ2U5I8_9ACTN|nr:phosphoribosyltransferase [Gordonia hydrophobica]MBM7368787.1 pyrimidine operon attenuation protein/uracil phosphoribosyltransferase [Gordonia hydrophobica]